MSSRSFEKPIKIPGRKKTITKKMIEDAQKQTKSNSEASRFLGISLDSYRKNLQKFNMYKE